MAAAILYFLIDRRGKGEDGSDETPPILALMAAVILYL